MNKFLLFEPQIRNSQQGYFLYLFLGVGGVRLLPIIVIVLTIQIKLKDMTDLQLKHFQLSSKAWETIESLHFIRN